MNAKLAAALGLGLMMLGGSPAHAQAPEVVGGTEVVTPQGQQMTAASLPGVSWRPAAAGQVPPDAMATGVDAGRTAYTCRVRNDGVRVGKLVGGTCLVPMSGAEIGFQEYEVLTGEPWLLRWPIGSGLQPGSGLVAGQVADVPALLCVVEHMGGVHPGMVIHDRCHFGLNGKEIMAVDYRYAEPNPSGQFSMRYAAGGWVPPGALTVAQGTPRAGVQADGAPPICLAQVGQDWVPGMLDPAVGCVYAAGAGVERSAAYTAIVGDPSRVAWVTYEGGELPRWEGPPEYSVRIGGLRAGGAPYEVCRVELGGQLVAGRVEGGRCLVAVAGNQMTSVPRYQVLHYIQAAQQAEGEDPDAITSSPIMPVAPTDVQ